MSDYLSVDLGQALIIDDDNANEFVGEVSVDGEPMARGLLPRDYNEDPFEGFCSPFPLPLIPRSEWVERIKDIEKDKARLTDLCDLKGLKVKNQGSTNYCWINAPVAAMEIIRLRQRQEPVVLSPASAGAIIKKYRNVGGWGTQGCKFLAEVGCVPVDKWPANAIDPRYDTAETRELRKHYRFTEWWDIPPKKFDYLATCLLHRIPAPIGLLFWMHEVLAVDLVKLDGAGRFGVRIRNSWGQKWGNNGTAILTESKATPDDVVAPRVALAA